MKLSIVIPTRNRASALDATLAEFCKIIGSSQRRADVEVVCVNNFAVDDTETVVRRHAAAHSFVKYHHQVEERHSAETSAFHAIDFATGEYVWLFGDDDTPLDGCVDTLIAALEKYQPSFALLNLLFDRGDETTEYINSVNPFIFFPKGSEFFNRFGLITTVTTVSCICFLRRSFDRSLFGKFAAISEIYSHSFGLLANYHDAPILFIAIPCLKYLPTSESEELERIGRHLSDKGLPRLYPFGQGLIRLMVAASEITGIPFSTISRFTELPIDRTVFIVRPAVLWTFITRIFVRLCQDPDFIHFSSADAAELQSAAARLDNPAAEICWDIALRLCSADHHLLNGQVIDRLLGALIDWEEVYFKSPASEAICGFETLFFQNGVVPLSFSVDGLSKPASIPPVVVVVRVFDRECVSLVSACLRDCEASLASISAKVVLWTNPRDASFWREQLAATKILCGDELPAQELADLGEYVIFLRPKALVFPTTILFALNVLFTHRVEGALLNRWGAGASIGNSAFFGDFPADTVLRELHSEECRLIRTMIDTLAEGVPCIVKTNGLLTQAVPRLIHVNFPLSIDVTTVAEPSLPLSRSVTDLELPPADIFERLLALNRLTLACLVSRHGMAPVSLEYVSSLYFSSKPDIGTAEGALVAENLLFLLAVRLHWENKWRFNETLRTQLAIEAHEFNAVILRRERTGTLRREIRQKNDQEHVTRRQRQYTKVVGWVKKHALVRWPLDICIRAMSRIPPVRKQLVRVHGHYFRPRS